jgi:DNA-directed RNA polymerase specialized sigma24 family protein
MNAAIDMEKRNRIGEAEFERRLEKVEAEVNSKGIYIRDFFFRLTRNWHDAEDLSQGFWKFVLLNFPEDKIGNLPLLRKKAYQLFVDHYRANMRRPEILTDEIPEIPESGFQEVEYCEAEETRLRERFWREFSGIDLSEAQKDVIWLHARYGFTYQEIEERTGVPSSTVGDWVAISRERILEYLNKE